MPATYESIASTTLTTSQATIEFTSINQSFTDLVLVVYGRGTVSSSIHSQWGNNSYDTGSNYSNTAIYGRAPLGNPTGNELGSVRASSQTVGRLNNYTYVLPDNADTFGTLIAHFMSYSNTTTNKTIFTRSTSINADDYAGNEAMVVLWRSTSAINQIKIYPASGSFTSGTVATLYGIKAA